MQKTTYKHKSVGLLKKIETVSQLENELETLYALVDNSAPLTRMTAKADPNAKLMVDKTAELVKAQCELEQAIKSQGGTTQNYESGIQSVVQECGSPEESLRGTFALIAVKRTATRYGFTIERGKQGPHTIR